MIPAAADVFDSLNPAQRRAATFGTPRRGGVDAGPLLILAGAGTGKTATLAHRTAYLILNGADPARILMLTFTRRAAQEMIRRTQNILARVLAGGHLEGRAIGSRLAWAGTFHSVGSRILRLYAQQLGLDANFSILDRSDAADLMDVVRHELGFSAKEKRFPRKDLCLAIYSHRVARRCALKSTLEEQFPWVVQWQADLTQLYREYVSRKQKHRALDFDDLLLYWHAMMQNSALAASLARNFDHVLVDEYQDTSSLQGEIVHALKPDGSGVTVVGDDAQAIYSFRAAAVENILSFAQRYQPAADMVVLTHNYRSNQPILDAANALMAQGAVRQHRKTLVSARQALHKPCYVTLADAQAQAEYIAGKILATRELGGSLKRHAVLFRSAHHSDVLEVEFARRDIPFVKYGGLKFLEAAHVKDLMSVLRWADNPRHAVAAFRVLKLICGIGPAQATRAIDYLEQHNFQIKALRAFDAPRAARTDWLGFCTLLERLADPAAPWPGQVGLVREWYKPQLERIYDAAWARLGDLEQLEALSAQQASRERFLTELTLDPPAATGDLSSHASKDEDYVILSTIHSAKGQEWDFVYVLNVADGNFPSEFAAGKPELIEEERRLLYVAMTRARNELHFCAPLRYAITQQAKHGDAHVYGAKSRFLSEEVLACFESIEFRPSCAVDRLQGVQGTAVDVAGQMKDMW